MSSKASETLINRFHQEFTTPRCTPPAHGCEFVHEQTSAWPTFFTSSNDMWALYEACDAGTPLNLQIVTVRDSSVRPSAPNRRAKHNVRVLSWRKRGRASPEPEPQTVYNRADSRQSPGREKIKSVRGVSDSHIGLPGPAKQTYNMIRYVKLQGTHVPYIQAIRV